MPHRAFCDSSTGNVQSSAKEQEAVAAKEKRNALHATETCQHTLWMYLTDAVSRKSGPLMELVV